MNVRRVLVLAGMALAATAGMCWGVEPGSADLTTMIGDGAKLVAAIHIMVMLLLGFGFLMVFVHRYGRSAITATYLLVALSIPMYFLMDQSGVLGKPSLELDALILAEFGAASLLICAGSVLGRLKMPQYLLLGILFVPAYAFNEWILLKGGLGLVPIGQFIDTGGSILIHAFGALFGLAAILSLTSRQEYEMPLATTSTSDLFSLIGSMALWVFWPSFCSALVAPPEVPRTVLNVFLALCGSTLATYVFSVLLRKKIGIADIANATLAGGVAIGSTCANVGPGIALVIGVFAGALSTFGFAIIQPRLQGWLKKVDTCGVLYLHGLPGLFGGFAAMVVVHGISFGAQLTGIAITVCVALLTGLLSGWLIALTGRREKVYEDEEEITAE